MLVAAPNAMGMFYHFIPDEGVRLIGCEAAGRGVDTEECGDNRKWALLVSSMA